MKHRCNTICDHRAYALYVFPPNQSWGWEVMWGKYWLAPRKPPQHASIFGETNVEYTHMLDDNDALVWSLPTHLAGPRPTLLCYGLGSPLSRAILLLSTRTHHVYVGTDDVQLLWMPHQKRVRFPARMNQQPVRRPPYLYLLIVQPGVPGDWDSIHHTSKMVRMEN